MTSALCGSGGWRPCPANRLWRRRLPRRAMLRGCLARRAAAVHELRGQSARGAGLPGARKLPALALPFRCAAANLQGRAPPFFRAEGFAAFLTAGGHASVAGYPAQIQNAGGASCLIVLSGPERIRPVCPKAMRRAARPGARSLRNVWPVKRQRVSCLFCPCPTAPSWKWKWRR